MTEQNQVYKCNICGNIVGVLHAAAGELVCCNQPMQLLEIKTEDQGQEKHVPVVEKTENGIKVKVGSVPHPMEEDHYIEWIEAICDNHVCRKYLKPGQPAEAEFKNCSENVIIREYCNLHGLWKA